MKEQIFDLINKHSDTEKPCFRMMSDEYGWMMVSPKHQQG